MCRMLGIVAARPVAPCELLRDAPRSLRALSEVHKDGWGVAVRTHDDWIVHRSTACAARCAEYGGLAERVETTLLIAHVRQRTVGEVSLANTHPFRRGAFVFAHNGTVRNVAALMVATSPARGAEVAGTTDSERLFAFVLTHIDAAGDVARGTVAAVAALHALGDFGSASFLLSCGARLFAHRFGRTLFTLARPGATIVASERLTEDEGWREIPERALVAIDADDAQALLAA